MGVAAQGIPKPQEETQQAPAPDLRVVRTWESALLHPRAVDALLLAASPWPSHDRAEIQRPLRHDS